MNRAAWTLTLLGGLAGSYYGLVGRLHLADMEALHREVDVAYVRAGLAEAARRETAQLEDTVTQLEEWRDSLHDWLYLDPVAQPPLLALNALVQSAGLAIERSQVLGDDVRLEMPHQRLQILAGGTFAELFTAVERLESSLPPTRITELIVRRAPGGDGIRAELTVVRVWRAER